MSSVQHRRAAFRALHEKGCFVLPNPWDGGSAIRCAKAGFQAIASTSAGAAWAIGKDDGEMTVDEVLDHLRFLSGVTDLPVNADFEAGFSDTAAGVAANVTRCIDTGVAGISIEDRDGDKFFALDVAVERIKAARQAIDASGQDLMLIGRCEAYLMKNIDMNAVLARLNAYGEAGADCLYAPGLKTLAQIKQKAGGVNKPVNANLTGTGLSVADMASVGVRRVSVGAAIANATYKQLDGFIEKLKVEGRLP
ncbi:isocitrate lyase/PEP mutase family protein [Aestuariivirga litoralis]|uniref:isocitrate lyase/PEP mutase family protein n=1 Tax=Aestuariivirga litoralis TaxID=2650924 RepID=UPI0018C72C12|nr:isocitrate lyase/phosphoenolpyruvate mutase family protein [Aestuariivirga litoralis]MBG1233146.1 isocitrate lyase/phosphoenolpyruvate mutase family protein [Aestuariivirga litoralis]